MQITLKRLEAAYPVLERLSRQQMPAQVSFRLARLQQAIAPDVQQLEAERVKLVKEYGQQLENGDWQVEAERVPEFTREYQQLLATEVAVAVSPIPITALPDSLQLSPMEMLALDFLIVEPDEA